MMQAGGAIADRGWSVGERAKGRAGISERAGGCKERGCTFSKHPLVSPRRRDSARPARSIRSIPVAPARCAFNARVSVSLSIYLSTYLFCSFLSPRITMNHDTMSQSHPPAPMEIFISQFSSGSSKWQAPASDRDCSTLLSDYNRCRKL